MVLFTILFVLFCQDISVSAITCIDVEEKESGSAFNVDELRTLSRLSSDDIKDCIIFLGKEPLSLEQAKTIWTALINVFGSASDIPEESLQHLGWITSGIAPYYFYNLTLTEVDTIASFGRCSGLSKDQLSALHGAIFEQWSSKEVEDLSSFDLLALRQVLCAFNGSDILKIHPDAYKDAALDLATLTNCTKEVLEGLATLASSPQAFGDPQSWTSLQLATIGCVAAGLPSIRVIPPEAMEGFTKNTITCLPPHVIKDLSDDQIMNLSPSAAGAFTQRQMSVLSQSQKYALDIAVTGLPSNEKSSGILLTSTMYSIILVIFMLTG